MPTSFLRAPRAKRRVVATSSLLLAAFSAFVIVACYSGGTPDRGGDAGASCTAELASITSTVFAPSCAKSGCHSATDRAGGLSLAAGTDLTTELVGVPGACQGTTRVVPGAPDQSLLYVKLLGTATCGTSMPRGAALLPAAEVACIKSWIAGLVRSDAGVGGDACGDTQTNASSCGTCGHVCAAGASCSGGACQCGSGLSACGAKCTDTKTDGANCGACGSACPTGAACVNGACACPVTEPNVCGGACVDTKSDPKNCGACGATCASNLVCANGACASSCPSGTTACTGACVNTASSFDNCGACGKVCPTGATCTGSQCACPSGQAACGGACIDTSSNPNDCGGCGVTCSGGTTCSGGHCACPTGYLSCGGACVASDASNCGTCGNVCAPGQACTNGACTCGSASVSFGGAVQPIFTASCTNNGCHTGTNPAESLNLTTGKSYAALVGVVARECSDGRFRVKAGDPAHSYVVEKLTNVNLCGGTQMPKTGTSLSSAELATITNWICEGAPNN